MAVHLDVHSVPSAAIVGTRFAAEGPPASLGCQVFRDDVAKWRPTCTEDLKFLPRQVVEPSHGGIVCEKRLMT